MEPRAAARSAIGPLLVGLAAWCALGETSVLTPDDPTVRLAIPAAWYWFPASAITACLVPGWRRRPLTATPALLATLPWWPVGVPALALVWSGAMAWFAILLAGIAAFVRVAPRDAHVPAAVTSPAGGSDRPVRSAVVRSAVAAAGLTVAVAVLAGWSLSPRIPGGDEPHYLIITQSLLQDGDIQIENNHTARDFAAYYSGDARPDFKIRGKNGAIYSIHAPGTSVVVLPAFAIFGYRGAQATIVLLAALASALMWYAAWLTTGDRRAAWVAWLAVAGTPTFIVQSVTIFPDSIGMFVVAAGVVAQLRLSGVGAPLPTWALVGASTLFAVLPWLHTRFSVLAAALGVLTAWLIVFEPGRASRERYRRLAAFFVLPVAAAVAWFGFFQMVYGTPNPIFPYGEDRGTRLAYIPGGLLGLFFDAQFGLVAYSPILAAALVGLFAREAGTATRVRSVARGLVLAGLAYLAASASYWMWWAGVPAPPARFAAAVLPVFVIPIAMAWRAASTAMRAVWLTLLAVSLAITAVVVGAARARIAWNTRGIRANWLDWLSGSSDLSRAWPSFFWRLDQADLTSELHFLAHVLVWLAIFCGSCALLDRLLRRRDPAPSAVAAVWWLAVALMAAIQSGWWLNGANGLSAAPSQVAALNAAADGRRVLQIRSGSIGPQRDLTGRIRIRAVRADEVGDPGASWQPLLDVPPGQFALSVSLRRPREGTLALRVGRSGQPLRRLVLAPTNEQTVPLSLPAGAGALFFEPDAGLSAAGERIELTPLKLDAARAGFASTSARFGSADVFFHGSTIYVEPDGFWVRGGQTADFTIAVERGRRTVSLRLANGQAANDLALELDNRRERLALAPFETRTIDVHMAPDASALVRLTARSGFRPSDNGASEDRRYLGVRVTIEE